MNQTYLEYISSRSKKFYEIFLIDHEVLIRAGRINHIGRLFKKKFTNKIDAEKFYQNQIQKKLKKGYKENLKSFTQLSFFSELDILRFKDNNKEN